MDDIDKVPGGVAQAVPSQDELRWGAVAHLSMFVALVGIPGPIGPLAVWLVKRGESAFVDAQAKEALNFSLSVLIYLLALAVLFVLVALEGRVEVTLVLAFGVRRRGSCRGRLCAAYCSGSAGLER